MLSSVRIDRQMDDMLLAQVGSKNPSKCTPDIVTLIQTLYMCLAKYVVLEELLPGQTTVVELNMLLAFPLTVCCGHLEFIYRLDVSQEPLGMHQ